jgi:hypothetical protein
VKSSSARVSLDLALGWRGALGINRRTRHKLPPA